MPPVTNPPLPPALRGLHHVTAIAKDPRKNAAFYTQVLGLRLVKQTVNFDDPSTYHLYFGDGAGSPGSILTFFPWPNVARGKLGGGETAATSFAILPASVAYWLDRLSTLGVEHEGAAHRFDETVIALRDHDGTRLELVARDDHAHIATLDASPFAKQPSVLAQHALRGFAGVSLLLRSKAKTLDLLTTTMGYTLVGESQDRTRLRAAGDATVPGRVIDLLEDPAASRGVTGSGTVHHIAFRTKDDDEQRAWQQALAAKGLHATEILDRNYFHSIYVREPGGVLFEFATDAPGFAVDEPLASLGTQLKLPAQYEPMREAIRQRLVRLD